MPYIGNNHIAGDHTNNFKVLDDISSFTATFDGSASSVIDTTNNTIRVVEHRFIQGQRVTYTNGGGGNIGGLTTGTAYFVIFDSASTIKLATSASNAANSTAINLSAVGSGSSHTLNVAFDGVNTKFKITYNSGTGARFNNATQLNIAINNVLQKPNVNSSTFTEGFAIEDNHKIVFKIAPTSEDIFWGSIIANTLTTFDISDHKIDTFTGDGSTTEFTLSHTPANNESLMVTINGVLQHPSNASTARAYTLIASIIQFTAAPGVGDEIQVRHLGFAGATTADVSGFYGRTGNVALTANDHITTGDITARNINASGILTASSASFGGNVSIGGTLTYEDVSNIDSVGIITARDGIHVGAGISAVGVGTFGGIKVGTGVTIETNGNSNFVGVSSLGTGATGAVYLYNPDADALSGTTNDIYGWKAKTYTSGLQVNSTLYLSRSGVHGLSLSYNNATGGQIYQSVGFLNIYCPGGLPIYLNAYQHVLQDPGGKKRIIINDSNDQAVHLYHNNIERFETTSQGINVIGHSELDNVNIAGIVTVSSDGINAGILDLKTGNNIRLRFSSGGTAQFRGDTDPIANFDRGSANSTNVKWGYLGADRGIISSISNEFRLTASGTIPMTFHSNGNERLRINSSGNIKVGGFGHNRDLGGLSVQRLHIEGTDGGSSAIGLVNNQNSSGNAALYLAKSRGSSVNSNTILQNGDPMGSIVWCGADGNDMISQGAAIVAQVDGTPGSNDMPGRLVFKTTADGSATATEKLRITSGGEVLIGTTTGTGNNLTIQDAGTSTTAGGNIVARFQSNGSGRDASIQLSDNVAHSALISMVSSNFAINLSGNERLRIDSSGKIGISRTPTQHPLEIQHASEPTVSLWRGSTKSAALQAQSGGTYLYSYENAPLIFSVNSGQGFTERLRIDPNGHLGINVASAAQLAASKMLTLRPDNDDGIRFVRPGGSNNSPNIHLDLTTTTSGSAFPSGEAYTTKYKTTNCDQIFETYEGGGTGGNISFRTRTSSGESLRINKDGYVTKPNHPAFIAGRTGGNQTFTVGTFPFNATRLNVGNHYNTSTYKFVAPVAGVYYFYGQVYYNNGTGAYRVGFRKTPNGGSAIMLNTAQHAMVGNDNQQNISIIELMAVGDTVELYSDQNSSIQCYYNINDINYGAHTYFMGYLIG